MANRDGSGLRKLTDDEVKHRAAARPAAARAIAKSAVLHLRRRCVFCTISPPIRRCQLTKTEEAETNPAVHAYENASRSRAAAIVCGWHSTPALSSRRPRSFRRARRLPPAVTGFGGGGRGGRGGGANGARGTLPNKKGTDSQESLKNRKRSCRRSCANAAKVREENEAKRKEEDPRKPFQLQARQRQPAGVARG